jgi:hypothetical protein
MTRRRFIQSLTPPFDFTEIIEEPEPRRYDGLLYGDRGYDGMQASDGADISTRSKHREYMKQNGLTTMDDFKETWAKSAEKRADYYTGKRGTVTRHDIAQAIHDLDKRSH